MKPNYISFHWLQRNLIINSKVKRTINKNPLVILSQVQIDYLKWVIPAIHLSLFLKDYKYS